MESRGHNYRGFSPRFFLTGPRKAVSVMSAKEQDWVRIFDTTLRDGEQSPGCTMNVEEKAGLAEQLDRLGDNIFLPVFKAQDNIDDGSNQRFLRFQH